jgi:hypothetical protein
MESPMDNVHSIKNFKDIKKIKLYVTHLKAILKVVDLSIRGLITFEVYTPVHAILVTMREQKRILESHLNQYTKILKERGNLND